MFCVLHRSQELIAESYDKKIIDFDSCVCVHIPKCTLMVHCILKLIFRNKTTKHLNFLRKSNKFASSKFTLGVLPV